MQIENALKRIFERDLADRIARTEFLTPHYKRIIGAHYFAEASTEALYLYRDGYYLGTIMCSQALLESLVKFIAKRNKTNFKGELEAILQDLKYKQIISEIFFNVSSTIWRHRNDFHHLNPGISSLDLKAKADECILGICGLEEEIFGGTFENGVFYPFQSRYYDISPDGTAPFTMRQLDV